MESAPTSHNPLPNVPLEKYKIVVLGNSSVGKTSLVTRFVDGTFDSACRETIGGEFLSKQVFLAEQTVSLHIWDTAGQEKYASLVPAYIRGAAAAIICYDITRRDTFDHVATWITTLRRVLEKRIPLFLCGSKCDCQALRAVVEEEGKARARTYRMLFMETSAASGYNVKEMFCLVAQKLASHAARTREREEHKRITRPESSSVQLVSRSTPDASDTASCSC